MTTAAQSADELTAEFKQLLKSISYCRSGWDYQLYPDLRAEENRREREALSRAHAIWAENPDLRDELRAAFKTVSPLATMDEIQRTPCPPREERDMTTAARTAEPTTDHILSLKGATVTLNDIRKHSPCEDGWRKLLAHLGKTKADDAPVSLITILDSNGLDDALWCLRALPAEYDPAIRLMACDMVEPALKFVPEGEDRPRQAIKTARRHARGEASDEELAAASAAARTASDAASAAAWTASAAASDAARAASDAARAAASDEQARIFRAHFA